VAYPHGLGLPWFRDVDVRWILHHGNEAISVRAQSERRVR